MKNDYIDAINKYGKLKCPECNNTNMRKMYRFGFIEHTFDIVANESIKDKKGSSPDHLYDPIYCGVCGLEFADESGKVFDYNQDANNHYGPKM